ncbi:MAG: prepilin-type N-terminal cleavage/methylation domain-containing protein [Eubacteriales bacterium]|jgi:prepilin-type N-terminal cleavage/methylation domain-containing protein
MLKRIRKNKKGFTLAELLIVVAIIGVLVAISIPIFTSQLEKAREATDEANLRAAYAEATADLLTGQVDGTDIDYTKTYYYDTTTGKITTTGKAAGKGTATVADKSTNAYAAFKGTAADGGMSYNGGNVSGKNIEVKFTEDSDSKVGSVFVQFGA